MRKPALPVILCLAGLLCCCSAGRYKASNRLYKSEARAFSRVLAQAPPVSPGQADSLSMAKDWAGTVNFNMRKPNFVIIHHTAQSDVGQTLKTFTISSSQVSAHYVIADDGVIHHMLNDYLRAYHAGVSKWGNITDLNSVSIGIELDNNGSEPFSEAQISSLLKLLGNLKKRYSIPTANFIAHADVAPKRKPDPHEGFPWKRLADNGFGLWYDENPAPAPPGFDPVVALRVIGYDTSDLNAAIVAFKRHFIQSAITPVLTQQDLNALNNLYRKYL